jgi:hypothetical protein
MEQAALLSTGLSLRVPLAEILNDSVFSASSGGSVLEQAEREQLGCRRCSWRGSSPGPQEDVPGLQDAEVGDFSPSPVKAPGISFDRLRIPRQRRDRQFSFSATGDMADLARLVHDC